MTTGKVVDLFPPGNDGSQEGAGRVSDSSGKEYVFLTPDNVAPGATPLAADSAVAFDVDGDMAVNIQKG